MLIFNDLILKECSASELASLMQIADAHGVQAVVDEMAQNREAIKAYVEKRSKEEAEEASYQKQLESSFM